MYLVQLLLRATTYLMLFMWHHAMHAAIALAGPAAWPSTCIRKYVITIILCLLFVQRTYYFTRILTASQFLAATDRTNPIWCFNQFDPSWSSSSSFVLRSVAWQLSRFRIWLPILVIRSASEPGRVASQAKWDLINIICSMGGLLNNMVWNKYGQ